MVRQSRHGTGLAISGRTGNTMAPCVVIGERAAEFLQANYALPQVNS
jgi:hypothetical protein